MSRRTQYLLELADSNSVCVKTTSKSQGYLQVATDYKPLSVPSASTNEPSSLDVALQHDCLFDDKLLKDNDVVLSLNGNVQSVESWQVTDSFLHGNSLTPLHGLATNILPEHREGISLITDSNVIETACQETSASDEEIEDEVQDTTWTTPVESDRESDLDENRNSGSRSDNLCGDEDGNLANKENEDKEFDDISSNKRKRQFNPNNWVRNVRKKKYNTGQVHTNSRKKIAPARQILGPCAETCKFECSKKISHENRENIFKRYWEIGDIDKQRSFILNNLSPIPHSNSINQKQYRKSNNSFYFSVNEEKLRVCKQFFIKTLGISDRMIRTVTAKTKNGIFEEDMRGKHKSHKTVPETIQNDIRKHINDIPRIESHYLRAQTTREFIDGGKSLADIYRDYKEICLEANKNFGNYTLFSRIFRNEFNISFFTPKKDQCGMCEELKNAKEKLSLQEGYDKHMKEKDLSRLEKKADKEAAQRGECRTVVFDLQAVLQTPCGDINSFYYKSKLSTYNFTMFDLGTLNGFCFVWHEGEGQRGANEISSCLYNFLRGECNDGHPVVLYCDNCSGQNKNKFVVSMLLHAVQTLDIPSISLKFLVVGHTQNEGDNMHSLIEKQKKRVLKSGPIYTPSQWIPVIANAKKTGQPYKITDMNFTDFFNFKSLQAKIGNNFTLNDKAEKGIWNDIAIIKVCKDEPGIIFYKNTYTDLSFKTILVERSGKRVSLSNTKNIELEQLYKGPLEISKNKLESLTFLCKKNHIISKYHDFYKAIGCQIENSVQTNKNKAKKNKEALSTF